MAMDGLSLHAMLWEARGLLGARVDKVQQPDKDTLLLSCHGGGCGRVKLLINIHNENGRIASITVGGQFTTEYVRDGDDTVTVHCDSGIYEQQDIEVNLAARDENEVLEITLKPGSAYPYSE